MDENKYFVMDETDAPYEDGERPVERTADDDMFLIRMAEKYGLEFKPDSHLGELKRQIKNCDENVRGN